MVLDNIELDTPFPSRNAADVLSQRILRYLRDAKPAVGSLLLTDADLATRSRLSHSTVRRALRVLHKDGWIERRPGYGSLVGPRVGMSSSSDEPRPVRPSASSTLLRIAVVVTFARSDWYVSGVLDALDALAADRGLNIELLSARGGDAGDDVARRLAHSRPHVMALITPRLPQARVVIEAARLGIPTVATGTSLAGMDIPIVCEDGVQGGAAAVDRLVKAGHTRIGYVSYAVASKWVFSRREGWHAGLTHAGIAPEENLVCWLPEDANEVNAIPVFEQYFKRHKPTAVVCASSAAMLRLGDYCKVSGLKVPDDLSVVTFDQDYPSYQARFGSSDFKPDVVALPLTDMAMSIVEIAQQLADGKTPEGQTDLPCELRAGVSVRRL